MYATRSINSMTSDSSTITDKAINLYGAASVAPVSDRRWVANFTQDNAVIAGYFADFVSANGYRKVEVPSSILSATYGMYRVFWYE